MANLVKPTLHSDDRAEYSADDHEPSSEQDTEVEANSLPNSASNSTDIPKELDKSHESKKECRAPAWKSVLN